MEEKYSNYQLCEIAYMAGVLQAKGLIDLPESNIKEIYQAVYVPILKEWEEGIENTFKDKGYIGTYAKVRLKELYKRIEEE